MTTALGERTNGSPTTSSIDTLPNGCTNLPIEDIRQALTGSSTDARVLHLLSSLPLLSSSAVYYSGDHRSSEILGGGRFVGVLVDFEQSQAQRSDSHNRTLRIAGVHDEDNNDQQTYLVEVGKQWKGPGLQADSMIYITPEVEFLITSGSSAVRYRYLQDPQKLPPADRFWGNLVQGAFPQLQYDPDLVSEILPHIRSLNYLTKQPAYQSPR